MNDRATYFHDRETGITSPGTIMEGYGA